MTIDANAFNQLIAHRRSIYPNDFTGAPVADEAVQQIIENANWAPTHRLTEPWRFVVFSREGRTQLATLQANHYKHVTEANHTYQEDRYQGLLKKPLECSHVIAVGIRKDPQHAVPEIEEVGAAFCAVQNMYLTATAFGIGCYFGTGGITYFPGTAALFGFDVFLGFLYLGQPKPGLAPKGRRHPVSEKVRWVTAAG